MKSISHFLCLGTLAFGLAQIPVQADDAKNLLPNPGFTSSDQVHVSNWVFSSWNVKDNADAAAKVEGKAVTDTDGHHCLTISASDSLHNLQMWWQNQDVVCAGGSSYELTVDVKGTLKGGDAHPTIGVYFLDADGKWLGFQSITTGQAVTLSGDWQKVQGKVSAPENAAKIGVRIGVVFSDGQADVFYKDPVLTQKSN